MELYQLVYISKAAQDFSSAELHDLLKKAKLNNEKKDITGNLLYNGGLFLQVLEGDKSNISELLDTISKDPRHKAVKQLYFEPAKFRLFPRWSMNMINLDQDTPTNLTTLKAIVDAAKNGTQVDSLPAPVKLLREFSNLQ